MSDTATFIPHDQAYSESDLLKRTGERVEVTRVVYMGNADFGLYTIKFPDGTTAEAFEDELWEWKL